MECEGGTYTIYSPAVREAWKATGRRRFPDLHEWVEAEGQHLFETERDLYANVPLCVKVAGKTSSATGHVELQVSPVDKTWYKDACDTVRSMIAAPRHAHIELRDSLRQPINDLDVHQLAHTGEVHVFVNGKRFLSPTGEVPKMPRIASPYKQQHLGDWYEGQRDALCNVVSDHFSKKSQQQVAGSLADGGSLERAICAFLERKAEGPAGESWPNVVDTYGMDRLARNSDPHRSAQHVSKEVMQALCNMLEASKEQVNAFYNRQAAVRSQSSGASESALRRANIFDDNVVPLSNGINTDLWSSDREMYNELAMDAFDQPALRDRIVELLHRQPHARQDEKLRDVRKEAASREPSPLGNPMQEYEAEVHHAYFDSHPLEQPAKRDYFGDYHETLDKFHLLEGLHPHPMSFLGASAPSEGKQRKARLVACPNKRKDEDSEDEEDDEYDYYHGKGGRARGATKARARNRMRERVAARLIPLTDEDVVCSGGLQKKEKKVGARLVPLSTTTQKGKARLVPLSSTQKGKARLVPLSSTQGPTQDIGDGLPTFEEMLAALN